VDSKNKKIMLSKYVIFDEVSLVKSIISQQVERMKTNDVSEGVEVVLLHYLRLVQYQ